MIEKPINALFLLVGVSGNVLSRRSDQGPFAVARTKSCPVLAGLRRSFRRCRLARDIPLATRKTYRASLPPRSREPRRAGHRLGPLQGLRHDPVQVPAGLAGAEQADGN